MKGHSYHWGSAYCEFFYIDAAQTTGCDTGIDVGFPIKLGLNKNGVIGTFEH